MPLLTRCAIRMALLNLLLGFVVGGCIISAKAGALDAGVWIWLPAHVDMLLVGWMIQLAMGMAYWILPRLRISAHTDHLTRGRSELAWLAFGLLNAGLFMAVGLGLLSYWLPHLTWLREAFPLGIALQVLALITFAIYAWSRVIPMPVLVRAFRENK